MRTYSLAAAVVSALALSVPAQAALIVNASDAVGTNYVIDFVGQVNGGTASALSSMLTLTFNGTSNGGLTYDFGYTMLNDSTVSANLRSFGFDVAGAGNVTATATGAFRNVRYNNNFPEGVGKLDVCFSTNSNGNCTGGSGGIGSGTDATGTLSLTFNSLLDSIALDTITTRYQSIKPKINRGDSGIGIGTPVAGTVPEPASWALMIAGFGMVGFAMRRRAAVARPAQG